MTDEQINAAVHVALGNKLGCPRCSDPECAYNSVPNYCTDLNAMAEAESTMTQLQWAYFVAKLAELTRQPGRCDIPAQILLQATSRQRAEAFLKAVEKWEVTK